MPQPTSVEMLSGNAGQLNAKSRIFFETRQAPRQIETSLEPLAEVLSQELELVTGLRPATVKLEAANANGPGKNDIVLRFDEVKGAFAETEADEDQSYRLKVDDNGATISSVYYKGVAYGTATLIQALVVADKTVSIPAMQVNDRPASEYRSVMLDVARKPHSIGVIQDLIRLARLYKLRYVHLHLTDNESFTFPFEPIVGKLDNNNHYSKAELKELVRYADARGVTLIPELDLPGHSSKVRASGYVVPGANDADVASPANYQRINAIIDDMLSVFTSSPYFHIGGDESGAGSSLVPFLASVNKHLRGKPVGGKRRLIVWEGFHGAPTAELPAKGDDRIIVMAWESSYNPPWNLLNAGYEIINSSWRPLYLAGGGGVTYIHNTGGRKFPLTDLHRWSKSVFMHWEPGRPIYQDRGPKDPDKTDSTWDARWIEKEAGILGGQMQFWEQNESVVMIRLPARLAAMADRLWAPDEQESFADFKTRIATVQDTVMKIVQPVQILPPAISEKHPITDFYQPYQGDSLDLVLQNRTGVSGSIRYTEGNFTNDRQRIGFTKPEIPTNSSPVWSGPMSKQGGFSVCARLFRDDGTPVEGVTWKFFNNWPNRVHMVDYAVGKDAPKKVVDLASLPEDRIKREYDMPVLRGPVQHTELLGQMITTTLTMPETGKYEIGLRSQNGMATMYLDLNRNGKWDRKEAIIQNTPTSEAPKTAKVRLKGGQGYPLRVDHMTGMPRPVLTVFLVNPETGKRMTLQPYLSMPEKASD